MTKRNPKTKHRVMVYVDGFNLFYGLRSMSWSKYYWLDLRALSERLLKPHQQLVSVRYFTSRITGRDAKKQKRQSTYLDALGTLQDLTMHFGKYLEKSRRCRKCGNQWMVYEEKMSDVNIAVCLLNDAQDDVFDTAMLISGDSDLVSPVESVINRYRDKRVIAVFPPRRVSDNLRRIATGSYNLSRKDIKDSQLPDQLTKPSGYRIRKPIEWY